MSKKIMAILIVCGLLFQAFCTAFISYNIASNVRYDDPMDNMYQREYDGSADYDLDDIINDEEKELGTDMFSSDTDKDGLGDFYEINTSKTDPTKIDTDKDTLSDYVEIKAGLNPLEVKSDGQTHDKDRTFEEKFKEKNVEVVFNGTADIFNTYCSNFTVTGLEKTPGVMSKVYEIYSDNKDNSISISFNYNKEEIENKGGSIDKLSIYTFENDGTFKKVKNSTIDEAKCIVTAKIEKSSKYLLADADLINSDHETKIMLLIDNSGSMYPEEMCEGSEENDVDFKRLDMAKSIIENINKDVEYGLAKFTGTYTPLCDLGSSNENLFSEIEKIRTTEEEFNGTYIATSIIKSLDNFTSQHNGDRKFIIILTDGASTEHSGLFDMLAGNPDENDAIRECDKKNVSVITIALGNSVEASYLKKIAAQTGGAYIYANNDDALTDIYNSILTQLVYSAEDIDGDGETDSYVVADSGFDMNKDAFSFENLAALVPDNSTKQHGLCYGMAIFAQTFYRGNANLKGNDFSGEGYTVPSFDIGNILKDTKNLRDYNNEIMNKYDAIYAVESKDRYTLKNGKLSLRDELVEKYKDEYISIKTVKDKGVWRNRDYKEYEMAYIDIEKYMNNETKNDDMEVICALYWHWALQVEPQNNISIVEYALKNNWAGSGNEDEYGIIIEKISEGIPLVVSFSLGFEGGHAINAIRVLRDIEKPNVYYLECYDNNDKNTPFLFKIEQSDIDFWSKTNKHNRDDNFSVRPYILKDEEWKNVSLSFEEIKK